VLRTGHSRHPFSPLFATSPASRLRRCRPRAVRLNCPCPDFPPFPGLTQPHSGVFCSSGLAMIASGVSTSLNKQDGAALAAILQRRFMDGKLNGKQTLTNHEYGSQPSLDLKILDRRSKSSKPTPLTRGATAKSRSGKLPPVSRLSVQCPDPDRSRRQRCRRSRSAARRSRTGLTEVPTLCLDHLTPAQVRAFMGATAAKRTWERNIEGVRSRQSGSNLLLKNNIIAVAGRE
jgi:hypothetical protein